ncbi:hypothetical protein GcM1_218041 [Golovinomyces cichoracearum]|uniref:Uncharacterized protein n=1 Tax=Golovinomyces cichoracearum TaxID=62708 RepID=A0A420ISP3_9PEZI|nr:hypothetical protein GcM1_218041 [Golovinomyces cichoracearum]
MILLGYIFYEISKIEIFDSGFESLAVQRLRILSQYVTEPQKAQEAILAAYPNIVIRLRMIRSKQQELRLKMGSKQEYTSVTIDHNSESSGSSQKQAGYSFFSSDFVGLIEAEKCQYKPIRV